jgi:DNA polymerase-1
LIVKGEGSLDSKIWLIGEAPGKTEDEEGRPFAGGAGITLDKMLSDVGIRRKDCYIDNVIQERPPNNNFGIYYADSKRTVPKLELIQAHTRIKNLVSEHRPNVVVALGAEALFALTGEKGILKWRGSILQYGGVKVIPVLHPANIMRMWSNRPVTIMDLRKVERESHRPEMPFIAEDRFIINPSFDCVMEHLKKILPTKEYVTFDIETIPEREAIMCIGFGWSNVDAICIPIFYGSKDYWTATEEFEIIKAIREFMQSKKVNFIAQNAQYDLTYIFDKWNVEVPNLWMDTMIAFHCVYPELKKSLAFLTSIYTNRPYYKDDGGIGKDPDQEWTYNCKDACATYECAMNISKDLTEFGTDRLYYGISHRLIEPLLRMQSRGVLIDVEKRDKIAKDLELEQQQLQKRLEKAVGHPLNVGSPKQMKEWLYDELNLPKQWKWGMKDGKKTKVITADEDAITTLQELTQNPVLGIVLEIRGINKLLSTYINMELDKGNRACCSYKITGTKSGRLSSSKSIYGRGTNLQNIPRVPLVRSMFIADPGYILVNADLSQAEARIVGYLAEDHRLQKLFEQGGDIHTTNAAMVFNVTPDKVTKEQRQLAKVLVHSANYGIGPVRFAKTIGSTPDHAQQLLNRYHNLYIGLKVWHSKVRSQLRNTRILETPLGRKRMFFDRWTEDMVRDAISYVPQSTVGDLLNYGIVKCWKSLPPDWQLLMQNHDAVLAQVPEDTCPEHVLRFFKHYFEIPLNIKGKTVIIPIDIKMGKNWGEMKELSYENVLG